ncbi:MAG: D-alanyl-D-alanine carboxypeptidase [Clostridiales bacterium]|nr:D-alanyl-D-alanine carboxypeptidase [Clostridiales bacterium]
MRRAVAALCALVLLHFWGVARCEGADSPLDLQAKAAILMDRATGRVLYEYNADEMLPIASTTKVMTALLALERSELDEIVTVGPDASGVPGTSIYLGVGEQLTMHQLLLGLLLRSGNDAAVAIADHVGGSTGAFVDLMNARAGQLGADAHFANPHGLDQDGHRASARGMAKIACAAMALPTFRELVATRRAVIPWQDNQYSRVLENKNRLLIEYEGATGIKTGFTDDAGRCLIFSAQREGAEYVGVLLGCGGWFAAAGALLDWGFATYDPVLAAQKGGHLAEVDVRGGERRTVVAAAVDDLVAPICATDEWRVELELPEYLTAPVRPGQKLGHAAVIANGAVLSQVELAAGDGVEAWNLWTAIRAVARRWSIGALCE